MNLRKTDAPTAPLRDEAGQANVAVPSGSPALPDAGAEPQPAFMQAAAIDFPEPMPAPLPAQ